MRALPIQDGCGYEALKECRQHTPTLGRLQRDRQSGLVYENEDS